MLKIVNSSTSVFFILLTIVVIIGCEGLEGPAGPPGTAPVSIIGTITYPYWSDSLSHVFIDVSGTSSVPSLLINSNPCGIYYHTYSNSFRFMDYYYQLYDGDSINVEVHFTRSNGEPGLADAHLMLPGLFGITSHDPNTNSSHLWNEGIIIDWSSAQGVEIYDIFLSSYVHYVDTSGADETYSYSLDSVMMATSITATSDCLFPPPAEVDSLKYGDLYFRVKAVCGPWQEGDPANVTGDGTGFITAFTNCDNLYLNYDYPE